MRASELLLIVRAQNQASGALRRVAGDMRGLSKLGGLQERGQRLQIARNTAMAERANLQNQLKSITTGTQALRLARERQAVEMAGQDIALRRNRIVDSMAGREASLLRNQAQRSRLQRAIDTAPTRVIRQENIKRMQAAGVEAGRLAEKQQYLARKMELVDAAAVKQGMSLQVLTAKEADAAARTDQLRNRIANYGDRLRLNSQQIDENNRAMSRARWDKVAAGGRMIQHSARVMQYAGLVLGGTLAVMAHSSAQFTTSVALAATQTRRIGHGFQETARNSEFLQKSILGLMKQFPASSQEMSAAAYDIYSSLNISLPGGVKLLKLFNQAAVAGQTSLQEVSGAAITVMNDFRIKTPGMTKAFQTMFAAVRFGRMTFKEFVAMMPQLSPAFSAAGFGLREMAQAAAFMTRVMPNTRMAATSLARLTEMFGRKDFIAGAEKMGAKITDVHKRLLPLPEIVDRLAKKFPEIGKAIKAGKGDVELQNFFKTVTALGSGKAGTMGTIQGRRAMIFLVTQSKLAHQVYGQVARDQNEFTLSLKAMEKQTGVRWGVFVNTLKAIALAIGAHVIPALLAMAGPIERIVKWWESLDDSTKRTVARFATFAAALSLVGGAFAFVSGYAIRLFAVLGRMLGFTTGLGMTFTILALAVAALTGHIRELSDILNVITNFAFGSWQGFAVTMGIVAASAIRLTAALRGLAAAEAVAGTAGGGGIIAGLFGRGRGAIKGASLGREIGGLRATLAGAAAGAGLLSAGLVTGGIAIAAGAAGLYLWKRHMDSVRRDAEAIKASRIIGAAPRQQFDVFQQLPSSVEGIMRANVGIRMMQRNLADLRKEASGATGRKRLDLLDQIQLQTLDIATAEKQRQELYAKANRQFDAYTAGLAKFVPAAQRVKALQKELATLQARPTGQVFGEQTSRQIANVRAQLKGAIDEMRTGAMGLERVFKGVVNQFVRMGAIPKPSRAAMSDMFNMTKGLGRMLTRAEMRAVIKAELDPAARRKLPADIRAIFNQVRTQRIKVTIEQAAAKKAAVNFARSIGTTPAKLRAILQPFGRDAKKEHDKAATFLKPLKQHIKVLPPTNLAQIGANISSGIEAGLRPITQQVIRSVTVDPFNAALGSHSPSRVMAREVGIPIVQGIIMGILSQAGQITKTATIVANLFSGTVLNKFDETKKKKITAAILTKDLQSQLGEYRKFNNALAKLTRRGVPKELVDQLAALGPEAANNIAKLANMSGPELRKYVKLWEQAQRQIKRSMRTSVEDVRAATKQLKESMMSNLVSTFNQIRDTNVSNFGAIFQGPTNLAGMTGDAFKSAMEDYNNSANDFRNQIRDLNNQIADAQREGSQRLIDAINARRDELQSSMGTLFSGDWLTGTEVQAKLDWGKKLGFDDLQKDLQSQVNKFATWRTTLTQLAAKVPPELGKQLEALGPEAVDKLQILNSGSSEQLAAYVALWQQGQNQIMAVANQTTVDTSDITAKINDILSQIDDVTQKLGALQMPHQLTAEDIIKDLQAQQGQWIEYGNILQSLTDRGLPAGLLQQLQNLGPEALPYLRVLNTMTDAQLKELGKTFQTNQELITVSTIKMLNTQLQLWFQYGQRIGIQIAAGIDNTGGRLQAYFKDLINQMLKEGGFTLPAPITIPSTTGGNYGAPGSTVGGSAADALAREAEIRGLNPQSSTTGESRTFYSLTVNQAQGEDLASTLEKATFRLANRRE